MNRCYQFLGSVLLTFLMACTMEAFAQFHPIRAIGTDDADKTSSAAYSIVSNDIDSTGVASAYLAHSFEIESEKITNGDWSFWLLNTENEYVQISAQNNSKTFTITPITNGENFKTDSNGNIVGIIRCTALDDGAEYTAEYGVTLELRPIITDIVIKEIVPQTNGQMSDIYFDVYYAGSDYLEMSIEREHSVGTRNSYIYEPYIAHIKASNIYNSVYSWIDILASNEYGTAVRTIEVSPEGKAVISDTFNDRTQIYENFRDSDETEVSVVSPSGYVLYKGHDLNEFKKSHSGLFIITSKGKKGKIRTKKCFI